MYVCYGGNCCLFLSSVVDLILSKPTLNFVEYVERALDTFLTCQVLTRLFEISSFF